MHNICEFLKRYWKPAILGGGGITLLGIGLPDSGWLNQDTARILVIIGVILIIIAIVLAVKEVKSRKIPKPIHRIISKLDKDKITDLMKTVNKLEDMMEQFFNEALYAKDRVIKYQSLIDSHKFRNLWNRYLSQRATINIVSPELEDRVRLLLSLIQGCHKNTLSKQYTNQLPGLSRQLEEQALAIENTRKAIKQTIKELIG